MLNLFTPILDPWRNCTVSGIAFAARHFSIGQVDEATIGIGARTIRAADPVDELMRQALIAWRCSERDGIGRWRIQHFGRVDCGNVYAFHRNGVG